MVNNERKDNKKGVLNIGIGKEKGNKRKRMEDNG